MHATRGTQVRGAALLVSILLVAAGPLSGQSFELTVDVKGGVFVPLGVWHNAFHVQGDQTIVVGDFRDFGSFPVLEAEGVLSFPGGWRLTGRAFVSKVRTVEGWLAGCGEDLGHCPDLYDLLDFVQGGVRAQFSGSSVGVGYAHAIGSLVPYVEAGLGLVSLLGRWSARGGYFAYPGGPDRQTHLTTSMTLGADWALTDALSVTTRAGLSIVGTDAPERAVSVLAGLGYRIR